MTLFGDKNTKNVVLEKSYKEYMEGFDDLLTGDTHRGYLDIVGELNKKFPSTEDIVTEKDKKEFTKLFGEYLRVENILQNYDEFSILKSLQDIDIEDTEEIEDIKNHYAITDEDICHMRGDRSS
nr:hypothetical protein [Peptostreptococcus russellii]